MSHSGSATPCPTNTAAGRKAIVADLARLAELHGCAFTADTAGRDAFVKITHPKGCSVSLHLVPREHRAVLCWVTESGTRFAPRFGDVNPHHHGKATKVDADPVRNVARGLVAIDSGRALMSPEHARELDDIDRAVYLSRVHGHVTPPDAKLARRAEIVALYSEGQQP